jgi:hypothetical protein
MKTPFSEKPEKGVSSDAIKRTRTSTGVSPHGPEPCASANSAMIAFTKLIYHVTQKLVNETFATRYNSVTTS